MFERQGQAPAAAGGELERAQLQAAEARWAAGAMSDEQVVVAITRAIENGAVEFEYQPVIGLEAPGVTLYRECLARIRLASGRLLPPSHFIPHLERMGAIGHFDAHVVRHAIGLLNKHPHLCLGVNLSAQSAGDGLWWVPVLHALTMRPDCARRLVIEITETAALPAGSGRFFKSTLNQLGCALAIDDFGTGYGAQTAAEIGTPDIVKLDRALLRGTSISHPMRLSRMVALAGELAPCVIVEGVESEADKELARYAGAHWIQGNHAGRPQAELNDRCEGVRAKVFGDRFVHGNEWWLAR